MGGKERSGEVKRGEKRKREGRKRTSADVSSEWKTKESK